MTALLLETPAASCGSPLQRMSLGPDSPYDERWLQTILFDSPGLVPLERLSPGAGAFVPLCREFALPAEGRAVYPDLIGVSRSGRLVIVECKLWRNPQARREVVAQVLEYASLLRGWSYGDLTARLKAARGWAGDNPIYAAAKSVLPDLDEVSFVEGLSESLARGDFHLVIAGDGIRSDLHAIAAHLNAPGMAAARLSLLEVGLWSDGSGRVLVVPTIPLRTEVIEQRVLVGGDGLPLRVAPASSDTEDTAAIAPVRDAAREVTVSANREFWQRFIDEVQFDHPDQSRPTHGGDNWVRLALPKPATGMTGYRLSPRAGRPGEIGLFVTLAGDDGRAFFETLQGEAEALGEASGLSLQFTIKAEQPFKGQVAVSRTLEPGTTDTDQRSWLCETANTLVTLLRPRLSQWRADHETTA